MSIETMNGSCADGLVSAMMGIRESTGKVLSEQAEREIASTDAGLTNLAKTRADYDGVLGQMAKVKDFATDMVEPVWVGSFLPAETILGDWIKPVTEAGQRWLESTDGMPAIPRQRAYLAQVAPVAKKMIDSIPDLPEHVQAYAQRYIKNIINGERFYDFKGNNQPNIISKMGMNAVRNLTTFNPAIVLLNVTEALPKTIAEYGIVNTMKGISRMAQSTGGKFWREIDDLAKQGIYGVHHNEQFKIDPLAWTENPNRAIYYYAAEAAGKSGLEGVEKLGYQYRFGHAPTILMEHHGMNDLRLMTFALGQARMYGQWAADLTGGLLRIKDGRLALGSFEGQKFAKGASALAMFSIVQAMQTGVDTAVPGIVWGVLDPETQDEIKSLNEILPTNIIGKTTGVNIGSKVQPVGGLVIGIGQDVTQSNIEGVGRGAKEVMSGDLVAGSIDMAVNSAMLLPPARYGNWIQFGNSNLKKLGAIAKDVVSGEISTPEEVGAKAIDKFIAKQE